MRGKILLQSKPQHRKRQRSSIVLLILIVLWSFCVGWGLAQATDVSHVDEMPQLAQAFSTASDSRVGTVDPVPPAYQTGQTLYLENCSTCHIALPPQVFPSETWRQLLQDTQHYGRRLDPLVDPPRLLIWNYLRRFSRPRKEEETIPYRMDRSRFFKALHPAVKLPRPTRPNTCISCHPGAAEYNFRDLTSEWDG